MKLRRVLALAGMVAAVAPSLYPCSQVTIGIWKPHVVREVKGKVIGWDPKSLDVIENNRLKPPKFMDLADAIVVLRERKDVEFFKERDLKEGDSKSFVGSITKYECGRAVAEAKSGSGGEFRFPDVKPGSYCLRLRRPFWPNEWHLPTVAEFLVDVAESGAKQPLLANISELMPDCTGGHSLKLVEVSNAPGSQPRN